MDPDRTGELATLLQSALSSTVVASMASKVPLNISTYRQILRRQRETYDPNFTRVSPSYTPKITNAEAKQNLLKFISDELSEFIHEDRIDTASAEITIRYGGGYPIEMFLKKLLEIAIYEGIQGAIQEFDKCAKNIEVPNHRMVLLNGVHIERETEILEGVRLIPLPSSVADLPSYLSSIEFDPDHFLGPADFTSKTLAIVDFTTTPALVNPSTNPFDAGGSSPFEHVAQSEFASNFAPYLFCLALSLVCNSPVQPLAWWWYIDHGELYNVSGRSVGSLVKDTWADWISGSVPALDSEIKRAQCLYKKLLGFEPESLKPLRVAIDRWSKSKMVKSDEDKMIDLGIALEILFMHDPIHNPNRSSYNGEIRYRFSIRGAWLLAENAVERKVLFKEFRKIYDSRSTAVHRGELVGKLKVHGRSVLVHEFVRHAQDLAMMALLKVIDNGKFPNWDELVFGSDHEEIDAQNQQH